MKTLIINGSPKYKSSNSDYYIGLAKEYMQDVQTEFVRWNKDSLTTEEMEHALNSDALLFCFPLYVDSIPSHLLRCLVQIQDYVNQNEPKKKPMIYVMVNNGFFHGRENVPAIECMNHWSKRCGFEFGQGCCFGAGGMIDFMPKHPDKHSMNGKIAAAIEEMTERIKKRQQGAITIAEPYCPSILYKLVAHKGWRDDAKKNGLKAKDLNRRL